MAFQVASFLAHPGHTCLSRMYLSVHVVVQLPHCVYLLILSVLVAQHALSLLSVPQHPPPADAVATPQSAMPLTKVGGPPVSAPLMPLPSVSGPRMSTAPMPGPPVSGPIPVSGGPVSGPPMSIPPGPPMSMPSVSGPQMSGPPPGPGFPRGPPHIRPSMSHPLPPQSPIMTPPGHHIPPRGPPPGGFSQPGPPPPFNQPPPFPHAGNNGGFISFLYN